MVLQVVLVFLIVNHLPHLLHHQSLHQQQMLFHQQDHPHQVFVVIEMFDVDVKGGLALKKYFGEQALAIFVKVPSLEVLESRLNDRGTETEESLSRRIYKAKFEMTFEQQFDVTVLNDDFARSSAETVDLVNTFLKA